MSSGAIILSGGKNSRMGRNKAFLTVGEEAIISRTVQELRPVVDQITIVTNQPELYQFLEVDLAKDIYPGMGPLGGIHAGLLHARYSLNFVVACDMPFVDGAFVKELLCLAEGYDVTIPQIDDYLQPLYAVYSKKCIEPIEECLQKDIRKIIAFYHQVRIRYVGESCIQKWVDPDKVFFNVNTPTELEQAQSMEGSKKKGI